MIDTLTWEESFNRPTLTPWRGKRYRLWLFGYLIELGVGRKQ